MKSITRPPFFFAFSSLDVGFIDKTGWLAGYVDYMDGVIVVEDEFLLARATTQDIADSIEAHERALWGNGRRAGGHEQPRIRVSDVDHRLIADLRERHSLRFQAIDKKNLEADVNLVNVLIENKQLLVSAKCEHLRRQLREGVWNKTKKDMARDATGGHFDLLAALRYGVRKAHGLLTVSPYPPDWKHSRYGPEIVRAKVGPQETTTLLPATPLAGRLGAAKPWWKRG